MSLKEKIAQIVSEAGCGALSKGAHNALVELFEKECAKRIHAAFMTRSVGKLLGDFAVFLDGKGFEVVNPERVHQEAPCSYRLAKQIFKNRNVLVPFMCKVALELRGGKKEEISYTTISTGDANVLHNFLLGLKQTGHALDYSLSDTTFNISLPKSETKRRFYRSEWAEECFRYIISKTVNAASTKLGVRNRIIPNVTIRRKGANTAFTEFDVVAQLGNRFYVFEVKSGPRMNIMQWAAREREFVTEDGPLRVIVCTIHEAIPCEIFEPQILVNLENLEGVVSRMFIEDFRSGER